MLVTQKTQTTGEGEPSHRLKGTVHLPTWPPEPPSSAMPFPITLLSLNKTTCLFCRFCADTITRALLLCIFILLGLSSS